MIRQRWLLMAALLASTLAHADPLPGLTAHGHYAWLHLQGNLLAQQKLLQLSELRPVDTLIEDVRVVDVVSGKIRKHSSVLVRKGRIEWIGDIGAAKLPTGGRRIDGGGRYLAPGLTDMHVHTHDDADYLLHLAFGVTSIREMNGWPWRLKRRRMVRAGTLLAPNMYIASRILNGNDLGGYAIALESEPDARSAVRAAARQGYDAIKIHNQLSRALFLAIVDEAKAVGLDLVGHIPVGISVTEAIAAGMHTAEHFKGYIDDSTLQVSSEDWLTPSVGMGMYLTPTFYTWREHQRGASARTILDTDGPLVLPHRRLAWQRYVHEDADPLTRLRQTIRPKSEEIFARLLPHDIRWLAGTDSGGYELMVPGEALIEELEIMEDLGLPPLEALRSATTRAAAAMHWSGRTGHIAPGMSADLLLLDGNPLDSVTKLRSLRGVMLRGVWLGEPASLVVNGENLDDGATVGRRELETAVALVEQHAAAGYAQATMSVQLWVDLAEELQAPDLAARLRALSD